jgi:uncharacterized protein YgbK (DUF1537 family)
LQDKEFANATEGNAVPELILVADDLTGASEAAAAFLLRTTRISIHLGDDAPPFGRGPAETRPRVAAVDTDSRRLPPDAAAARVAAVADHAAGAPLLKKVDSLLRGNLAAEVGALRDRFPAPPVVTTALPAGGRVVRDGVVHVDGRPLHRTRLWHAEDSPPPVSVPAALAPIDTVPIGLPVIRGGTAVLARALAAAAAGGAVAVCDAETDGDLDAVYAAAHLVTGRPVLVGSAGLAAAAARAFPPDDGVAHWNLRGAVPACDAVLVVVGTAAPSAAAELAALEPLADAVVRLDPRGLLADPGHARGQVSARVAGSRCAVVTLHGGDGLQPALAPLLAGALADAVQPCAKDGRALVLTGGETARAVLRSLGVGVLRPLAERAGAVTSLTQDGQVVVTRPGSFGRRASLVELVTQLLSADTPLKEPT